MAARENKAIARRIFDEVINTGDLSLAGSILRLSPSEDRAEQPLPNRPEMIG
jgi:hypothetical protein